MASPALAKPAIAAAPALAPRIMSAVPTASVLATPVTNADKGTFHQIVKAPGSNQMPPGGNYGYTS